MLNNKDNTPTLTLPFKRGRRLQKKIPHPFKGEGRVGAVSRNLYLVKYARKLRRELTPWERKLWFRINNEQLGYKFRRQNIIANYIVDFYCSEKNLIIELDVSQHIENKYDVERDEFLISCGYNVLRFWNNEIDQNIESVLSKIVETLASPPTESPAALRLPLKGGVV